MILAAKIISWIALAALIVPSILFLGGRVELHNVKLIMMLVTIVWFITAGFWMWRNSNNS